MAYDIAEFDVETNAFHVNVRLEPATQRGPGITINGIFVPLQHRDEAREAVLRIFNELDPHEDRETAIEKARDEGEDSGYRDGHADGRDEGHVEGWNEGHAEGWREGRDVGWGEGYSEGKKVALDGSDTYASGYNDGWDAAKADSETED